MKTVVYTDVTVTYRFGRGEYRTPVLHEALKEFMDEFEGNKFADWRRDPIPDPVSEDTAYVARNGVKVWYELKTEQIEVEEEE